MIDIKYLLQQTIDLKASDLHLVVGNAPVLRIDGELRSVVDAGILTPELVVEALKQVLTSEQFERLTVNKEIDFSLISNIL